MTLQKGDAGTPRELARQIVGLMLLHGDYAAPRAYEVWHAYLMGSNLPLKAEIDALVAERTSLTAEDVDRLHERYLLQMNFMAELERTSSSMATELDNAVELMELVSGNAHRYGASLDTLASRLDEASPEPQSQHLMKALLDSTRTVLEENRRLEARLFDTRSEIQTLRQTIETVRVEAFTDPLTRLSNRKHFELMLASAIEKTMTDGQPLSLIMLDIDHFKHFNDTYGHPTGDRVLMLVAAALKEDLPKGAVAARYGGEEFAIVLQDIEGGEAQAVAERIRRRIEAKELIKRSTGASLGRLSVSLGIAGYRRTDSAASFVERCDLCLLIAKRMGRNRCVHESALEDVNRCRAG